ncbi:MAG: hypothetical protein ABWY00_10230 [Dongiaceae bacterium]
MPDRALRLLSVMGALLLAAGLLGACSTASDHADVITSFSTATEQAATALKEYDAAAAARVTEITRQDALSDVPKHDAWVSYPEGECLSSSTDCNLRLYTSSDEEGRPLTVDTLIPRHVEAAEAIVAYTQALKDLAAADSTEEVSGALSQISVTISSLANVVQPGSGPAAAAITGPTGSALAWVYGKYQESLKMSALREATAAMDPVIQKAVTEFARVETISKDADVNRRVVEFQQAMKAYNRSGDESHLTALLSAQKALQNVLVQPPGTVFQNIGEAHAKLVHALSDRPESFADVKVALQRIVVDAKKLNEIAKSFKEATGKIAGEQS